MAQLFKDFPLAPELHKALEELKFTQPTDIQAKALPLLMGAERVDFHGQAQTGTGKTLAFGLPLIQEVSASDKSVQGLVVAPTRELVLQICEALEAAAKFKPIKIDAIYGGVSIERQVGALKRGIQIVVGTPGRLNDLLRRKQLKLDKLKTLVLDEADIMLDMGFKEEVDEILKFAPRDRQIWLFSATVKPGITEIKRTHMNNVVSVKAASQQTTTKQTKQYFCVAPSRNRLDVLCRLVDCAPGFYGMIFCRTKILTAEVSDELLRRGYGAKALHGDLSQIQRNRVIKKFKDKEFPVLVATDVAARGIDVSDLTHVINYSLPEDQESYVHRIGRTGRAGKEGIAITLIGQRDGSRLKRLARRFNADIKPLEVPQLDDIIQARVSTAIDHFETATTQASPFNGQLDGLKDTLKDYTAEQLISGVVNLLSDKFLKGYENQKDGGFKSAGLIDGPDVEEVCLSVGTDDGISYEDILQLLLKKAELTEGQIQKLRVINRRSFITVSHDLSSKILRGLRGVEIGGRKIRMHVTQEDDFQRRRSSRPSRGRGGNGGGGYRRSGGGGGGYRGGGRRRR